MPLLSVLVLRPSHGLRRLVLMFLLFLVALVGVACPPVLAADRQDADRQDDWSKEEKAAQQAYSQFQQAVMAGQADRVVALTTASGFDYMRSLKMAAMHGHEEDIRRLPVMDLAFTLFLRASYYPDELQRLYEEDILAIALTQNFLDRFLVQGSRIGKPRIARVKAIAPISRGGQLQRHMLVLRKHQGVWRVDPGVFFQAKRQLMRAQVEQSGADKARFARALVSRLIGQPLEDAIWDPPFRAY